MGYNQNATDSARPMLGEGESILWQGRPERGNYIYKDDIPWMIIAVVYAAAVLPESLSVTDLSELWVKLPLALLFLCLLFAKPISRLLTRRKTVYYITERRVIASCGKKTVYVDLGSSPSVQVIRHKNGNVTIHIGEEEYTTRKGHTATRPILSLQNIADADRVQALLLNTK